MNFIEIDFTKVQGYSKLSERAKILFERVYEVHNAGQGSEYKQDWIPVKVIEHKNYLEVHFKNGDWSHYYSNGTWG